jgi:hypothetical protein
MDVTTFGQPRPTPEAVAQSAAKHAAGLARFDAFMRAAYEAKSESEPRPDRA